MRLVIDFDEKYKNLFCELAKATGATIVEPETDFWAELPDRVKTSIEKSVDHAKNGHATHYDEVKKMLAYL